METNYRIPSGIGFFMIAVAIAVDALQAGLEWIGIGFIINWLITLCAYLGFWLWLKIRGVGMFEGKNFLVTIGTIFSELIPGWDEFTWFTIDIVVIVRRSWKEDAAKAAKKKGDDEDIVRRRIQQFV